MVGEVRDEETVELGIRAALTGHLVFSTVHTNDAASGFTRLLNWNVEPFLIASTVKGILAQRLVRRICKECKEPHEPSREELRMVGVDEDESIKSFVGKGCLSCRNTGFKGRIGIYELLLVDAAISELNHEKRKVSLSIKLLEEIQNKEAVSKFSSPLSGKNLPFSSLSEKLGDKKNKEQQTNEI